MGTDRTSGVIQIWIGVGTYVSGINLTFFSFMHRSRHILLCMQNLV
jgi:hypothetical protein